MKPQKLISAVCCLRKSLSIKANKNELWDTARRRRRRLIFAACHQFDESKLLKNISVAGHWFNSIEYGLESLYYSIEFPNSEHLCNGQQWSHFALSFFLYQFQLTIDFVTGSEEFLSFFFISWGLYKKNTAIWHADIAYCALQCRE